jgi:hypothetical protein
MKEQETIRTNGERTFQFLTAGQDRKGHSYEELVLEVEADRILFEAGYDINGNKYRSAIYVKDEKKKD